MTGPGVHLAADGIDRRGDVERATPGCALEKQMLEEMRDPADARVLVPGPDVHPGAERDGPYTVLPLGDDSDAVGQDGTQDPVTEVLRVRRRELPSVRAGQEL